MNRNDNISYQKKVEKLQHALREIHSNAENTSLYKTTSNLFRSIDRSKKKSAIDVREFNKVIKVDVEAGVAEVEGMTTYEELVRETLKVGLLPAVVPQLKTITVGGAYAGGGIESSSFRYGLVHDTVSEADILISNGAIVQASSTSTHKDLFYAFPNTYGSLGYALKVKLQLIPAKPFVHLQHNRFFSRESFFSAMQEYCRQAREDGRYAYIDGVAFSDNELYITTGVWVDDVPYVSDYTYRHIYYKSIQVRKEDYLTVSSYIWRWDADWFWCSKVFWMQNPFMRLIFGKWMLSSAVYSKIMHCFDSNTLFKSISGYVNKTKESIIQDILIPIHEAANFFDFFQQEIKISPVWVCPTYSSKVNFDFCPLLPDTLYLDFGFWDAIKTTFTPGHYNRKIEEATRRLNGFKSLYSSAYYTEEEFWRIYNQRLYASLKQKYDPQARFKDLYRKVAIQNA